MRILSSTLIVLLLTSCSFGNKKQFENDLNKHFENIKTDADALQSFFTLMPKGGDIHHHASGTPYAEEYILLALRDSCYINPHDYQLYANKKEAAHDNDALLINALLQQNPNYKDSIIDNWSVRNHKAHNKDGREQFFSTFSKFKAAFVGNEALLLSAICKRAAKDNIAYIESMIRVPNIQDSVAQFADKQAWIDDTRALHLKLDDYYQYFINKDMDKWAQAYADSIDSYHGRTDKHGVALKFQTYGVRVSSNQAKIFGHLILAFEAAALSDQLVGVNFVAPEDNINALRNYKTHMAMFRYLSDKYPNVKIALHAGELVLGKGDTQAEDLTYHINDALKTARASRIGHGVDLKSENDYLGILDFMKENNCAIEINLESNAVILETTAHNHPVGEYLKHGIPVCIATDDEGVLRTNLINQYMMLVSYVPDIKYTQVKEIVFNTIGYSFLDETEKKDLLEQLEKEFQEFEHQTLTSRS
ncbi:MULTISPECIES: hypothetical protein [unclassified Carboxylicivirga]|uniref:hypothetical protein n=1 Tax=Carboxylicivirga TaxID=1628153 RepID=UPI003D33AAD9